MSFNEPETEAEDQDLKSVPTEMVYDRQHHLETYKVLRRKIWYNPHVTLPYTQTTQARPDQFYETNPDEPEPKRFNAKDATGARDAKEFIKSVCDFSVICAPCV